MFLMLTAMKTECRSIIQFMKVLTCTKIFTYPLSSGRRSSALAACSKENSMSTSRFFSFF